MSLRYKYYWIGSLVAIFALLATPAMAGEWTDTEVFVAVDEAAELIEDGATVVDARERDDVKRGHIDGATNLHWQHFVNGSASGAIIDDDQRLGALLRRAGISNDTPVIIYGHWSRPGAWGEEGRIYWTLDYLGHPNVHILEGGIDRWRQAGHPLSSGIPDPPKATGDFTIERRQQRRADTAQLYRNVRNGKDLVVLDARELAEYRGEIKYGEERPGHIPGAEHLWWRDLFDDHGELKSRAQLHAELQRRGINADTTIVAYCTGGIRSGFVYAVLRAAGLDIKNYDASMWEWTRQKSLPLQR